MWDEKPIYLRIETGYGYTKDMDEELVVKINIQTFTQRNASLKIKYYNPPILLVQHIPVEEKVNEIEVNRLRNG